MSMPRENTVFIVDDDSAVRDALGLMLSLNGYRTSVFADAEAFLRIFSPDLYGCMLLDIRMPGIDGLALQKLLLERGSNLPVLVITGHGDVHSARAAFRSHAVDFLEKPLQEELLLRAIEEAFSTLTDTRQTTQAQKEYLERKIKLTAREHEVMLLVVDGRHNREIALALGISTRTVEVHKSRMMEKLNVASVADLVRQHLQHGSSGSDLPSP
jgi:FixJ family two-component response regulator